MGEINRYPTEPLKCWNEAKVIRAKFYEAYVKAHENGGIRYAGSTGAPHALMRGLGRDVYNVAGEPYGASVAYFHDFSAKCEEAGEKAGISRDLCAYLRNYWGSVIIDKFILPDGTVLDGFPKPDFSITFHICCSHAKWYQYASEMEGGVPFWALDAGPRVGVEMTEDSMNYIVEELGEGIEWLEKATGRTFDDELFVEGINNEIASYSLWADVCTYNQAIPAPLDEKSMYSLYVLNTMCPQWEETVHFYEHLRDEVKDRVERGIAAVPTEKYRLMTDSQPPWGFLEVFRYLEKEYGVVSIGSLYSMGFACWDFAADGSLRAPKTPKELGLDIKSRQDALRAYAQFKLGGWKILGMWSSCQIKNEWMMKMVWQWKVDGVMIHLNRGCEGAALGQMENRLALVEAGVPVVTYEGNMADNRDFDYARTLAKIEAFLDSQELKKIS